MLKPTVGRIVHYYGGSGVGPFAAMVTGVSQDEDSGGVHLHVFPPDGEPYNAYTFYSEEPVSYTNRWCWPPRS